MTNTLPPLEGYSTQIPWATAIRQQVLDEISTWADLAMKARVLSVISQIKSASFWFALMKRREGESLYSRLQRMRDAEFREAINRPLDQTEKCHLSLWGVIPDYCFQQEMR